MNTLGNISVWAGVGPALFGALLLLWDLLDTWLED